MVNILVKNMFMPIFMVASVISLLDFITSGKKLSAYISLVTGFIGLALLTVSVINPTSDVFMQIYLLLFLLSISLVIMALQKQEDRFTIIGIGLMVVMLYLLIKFPLI